MKVKHHFLLFLLLLITALPAQANVLVQTTAKQAVIMDFETGQILFNKNGEERMPTSSMSKTMTLYLVFEALKTGQISLDDKFLVSEKAWRKGGSKMFVEVDKRVKIEDLIQGVAVQSGNDATIVLAEGLAGTEAAFAQALNVKAKELGMNNSHFMNASGWPDPDHYSTAMDLAKLARAMIKNFPEYYKYFSEKEFTYNNIRQQNRNPLLYRNMGADGMKTGHTEVGGYGLIASGVHNGRRAIVVLNGLKNEKARAQEGARLLEFAMLGFKNQTLFKAGDDVEDLDVFMGQEDMVPATVEDDVRVTLPTLNHKGIKVEVNYNKPLKAPIKKGQGIGKLVISIPRMPPLEYKLVAKDSVKQIGFIARTIAKAKLFLGQTL